MPVKMLDWISRTFYIPVRVLHSSEDESHAGSDCDHRAVCRHGSVRSPPLFSSCSKMDRHVSSRDRFLDDSDSWYRESIEPFSQPWVEAESLQSSPAPFVGSDVGESAYYANGRQHGSIPATLPLLQLAD
jgi:hypothetical protein